MKTRYDLALVAAGFLVWTTLDITVVAADTTGSSDPRLEMVAALQALDPPPSLGEQARVFGRLVRTWDVEYTDFSKNGNHRTGQLILGWVLDGRVTQDVRIVDPCTGRAVFVDPQIVFPEEASSDNGETWRRQSDYHMTRRAPAPGEQ